MKFVQLPVYPIQTLKAFNGLNKFSNISQHNGNCSVLNTIVSKQTFKEGNFLEIQTMQAHLSGHVL